MKKIVIGTALLAALNFSACTANQSNPTTYADYVAGAKVAHAKAVEAGNVWKQKKMKKPYVQHYLAKAEEAKKKGNDAVALKFAKEAHKSAHAEVAQTQDWEKHTQAVWEK